MGFSLFMFLLGTFMIGLGLYRLRKPFSAWFLAKTPYTVAGAYCGIPLGLTMLSWGILPFVTPIWAQLLFFGGIVTGIVGTVIVYTFFKPAWLKWLEQEYGSILPILENEAREIGYKALDQRINSQQDLEVWVAEVRRKYGR